MDLFSRNVMLSGAPATYMAYATEMRTYVSDKLGQEIALWAAGFGAPRGAMTYTARVDGLAGVQAMNATLMGDADYVAKLAAGASLGGGPAEDSLMQPLHGEMGDPPPVGSVATVTSAVVGNGAYADAIGWGIEMAQLVESISGTPTIFGMSAFGTFGQVVWINVAADAAAADAAGNAVNANADYMGRLSAIGDLFVPASGHRSLATRIA
jgi:hypothetical protein